MSLFRLIYDNFRNSAYLLRSSHSRGVKKKLFLYMAKINLRYLFTNRFVKLKKEKFFNYRIHAFDYKSIRQLFEEIFYRNEYYFKAENKSPVIIDCGANIGFSIIYFKWLYPESTIYGFEPDKKTFELLEKNIKENGLTNVHLINSAVSNKQGKIDFFIDSEHPGELAMSTRYGRMPKDKVTVSSTSLSSFIKEHNIKDIDFIKMDIEGSEKEVLKDLEKNRMLSRVRKMLVEYHHKITGEKSCLGDYIKILEKNKFEYQIDARCIPISSENKNQTDILLYCYKERI